MECLGTMKGCRLRRLLWNIWRNRGKRLMNRRWGWLWWRRNCKERGKRIERWKISIRSYFNSSNSTSPKRTLPPLSAKRPFLKIPNSSPPKSDSRKTYQWSTHFTKTCTWQTWSATWLTLNQNWKRRKRKTQRQREMSTRSRKRLVSISP